MVARVAGALALAALLVLQIVGSVRLANRSDLDGDEVEFLQGGLRIARGERIYVDFMEHHAPFLFQFLSHLRDDDAGVYVRRARAFSGVCGAIALAVAALFAWRATRQLYAPAILIGTMAAEPLIMDRAFADVRPEPPTLALFLLGALLIASRRQLAGALGVGFIVFAFFVNPKWPLSSLALVVVFIAGEAPLRRAALAAAAVVCALLLLAASTDPRTYVDFVFRFNRYLFQWKVIHGSNNTGPAIPFLFCPAVLWPQFVLPAAAVVAFAARQRTAFADVRIVRSSLLLLAVSLIELRFVHAYPVLWPQYFIVWALAASAIYACVPQAVAALVPPRVKPVTQFVAVVFAALAVVQGVVSMPLPNRDPGLRIVARLAAMLGPADTVFLGAFYHPVGARDAGYYWFGFPDVTPAALAWATTPRGRAVLPPIAEADLPPCRLERGLEPHLRLIGGNPSSQLPIVRGCVQRLLARGVLVPTHAIGVYRVRRPGELQ